MDFLKTYEIIVYDYYTGIYKGKIKFFMWKEVKNFFNICSSDLKLIIYKENKLCGLRLRSEKLKRFKIK
jgi:hypothetical protein